jgi:hypothetical protein
MPWHPLDDGVVPEPDWGQLYDGQRPDPTTDTTVHTSHPAPAEPELEPEPELAEPDWDALRGDGPLVDEPDPDPPATRRAPPRRRARRPHAADISDPVVDTPGGLIRRSRTPMGNHRGDLDQTELQAYEREPRFVRMMRRRNWDHWRV